MSTLAQVGKELVELPNRARILEKGRDGRAYEPIRETLAISLILQQRGVSGSPSGSSSAISTMLDVASRHNVTPQTEHFPMSNIGDAFARLGSGKARYRIVLDADCWSFLERLPQSKETTI
jgi:D-arabinose 1-dehydrogenase-like Zn-dependent alcohol dehydrogenase